jgi:mannose-1-phosphate guanylyltransferase
VGEKMKAVVLLNQNEEEKIEKVVNSLLSEGIGEFIIFSCKLENKQGLKDKLDKNGIKATFIDLNKRISTFDALDLIRGSLESTFLLVYSEGICDFDVNDAHFYHKANHMVATLLSDDKMSYGIFLENDIFDYMIEPSHFEKVILKRIFEDGEAGVYSILSYEVY